MKNYNFNQTGGFPITTDIFEGIEETARILQLFAGMCGNLSIITGCEVVGTQVSSGLLYINGELLEFTGGVLQDYVIIAETDETAQFEDGMTKVISTTRYATFGVSTTQYLFSEFKRVPLLNSFFNWESRLQLLEMKTAPIKNNGIVMIWPRTEPIPQYWKECTDLRGKTVMGYDPDYNFNPVNHVIDFKLNQIGSVVGELQHQLTATELPKLTGQFQTIAHNSDNGSGISTAVASSQANISSSPSSFAHKQIKIEFGADKPHNNMQPSLITIFIEPDFPI